jgi:DNA (cytosine-5)-methyltransferase 1
LPDSAKDWDKANTINTFDVGDIRTTQAIVQPTIIDRAAFNQGANAQYDIKIEQGETMSSLVAKGPHGVATQEPPTMAIRRLLPTECEILQGFPRNWTLIPYRNKPADQCPDGPRYKACGNSMAVPCMAYLGRRIQMVDDILNEQYNGAAAIPQL